MSSSDDRLRQLSAEWAAGRITDAEYQAAYEAVDAKRARPKGMTPAASSLPGSGLPRRANTRIHQKVFGSGRPASLDRNAKARIVHLARALMRRTEQGKHYGQITAKAFAVLQALLWASTTPSPALLPQLREDRRGGWMRPQHCLRGHQGAGGRRAIDLGEPPVPGPRVAPGGLPVVGATAAASLTSNGYRPATPNLLSPIFHLAPPSKILALFLRSFATLAEGARDPRGGKRKLDASLINGSPAMSRAGGAVHAKITETNSFCAAARASMPSGYRSR